MLGMALLLFQAASPDDSHLVGTLLAIAVVHAEQPIKVLIATGGHDPVVLFCCSMISASSPP